MVWPHSIKRALFAKELLRMFGKEIKEQFKHLQKSGLPEAELHRTVRFKDKFEAILEERYDDAVVSLREERPGKGAKTER